MAFRDNGDGTVSDLNTGLMWSKGVDAEKLIPEEAEDVARGMTLGGHNDWRVPNIKELCSLIDFQGYTGFTGGGQPRPRGGAAFRGGCGLGPQGNPGSGGGRDYTSVPNNAVPFINTDYFDFRYGGKGERYIDAQWLTSTIYTGLTMERMKTMFGVNFADGRIKGYGYTPMGGGPVLKKFYARYVRGPAYGQNQFMDNGDGTVSDLATGLMWTQQDSGKALNWEEALAYAEDLILAGHDDWRVPNAKELQYIVDYTRSPDATGSAALAPVFQPSAITNEAGQRDFPCYWTSTTHLDGPQPGSDAAYIAVGRALGQMRGRVIDVHGAGAQRSDPKVTPTHERNAPQGDVVRASNYVLCVRGGGVKLGAPTPSEDSNRYPNQIRLLPRPEASANDLPGPGRGGGPGKGPGGPGQGGGPGMGGPGMGGPGPGRGGFVARLDRDGDGRVSRAEFDGPPDRFDYHGRQPRRLSYRGRGSSPGQPSARTAPSGHAIDKSRGEYNETQYMAVWRGTGAHGPALAGRGPRSNRIQQDTAAAPGGLHGQPDL